MNETTHRGKSFLPCSRRVTFARVMRLLDSAGRPARFAAVTAAPHGCGAVSVWVVDGAETCSPAAIADAGL